MSELIEKILKEIAPFLRGELNAFGYPAGAPEADDLLQEAHIRLWKALEIRAGKIDFIKSYTKRVVFSVYINEIERIQRERRLLRKAESRICLNCAGRGGRPEGTEALKETVIESLSLLSRSKRLVIGLCLEGFTLNEIAVLNNWPLSKVRNDYYHGIRELKRQLSTRGIGT